LRESGGAKEDSERDAGQDYGPIVNAYLHG